MAVKPAQPWPSSQTEDTDRGPGGKGWAQTTSWVMPPQEKMWHAGLLQGPSPDIGPPLPKLESRVSSSEPIFLSPTPCCCPFYSLDLAPPSLPTAWNGVLGPSLACTGPRRMGWRAASFPFLPTFHSAPTPNHAVVPWLRRSLTRAVPRLDTLPPLFHAVNSLLTPQGPLL